jgi:hypothetical protein
LRRHTANNPDSEPSVAKSELVVASSKIPKIKSRRDWATPGNTQKPMASTVTAAR